MSTTEDTTRPRVAAPDVEWTARRLRWGLPRCVYAAAHDVAPEDVERTDRGYARVHALIRETEQEYVQMLCIAAGLPQDTDYEDLVQWIEKHAEGGADRG